MFRVRADDCVLYRNISRSEDQQIHVLQDDLNKLATWEEVWLMKFNVAKCNSVRVTKQPLHTSRLSVSIPYIIKF